MKRLVREFEFTPAEAKKVSELAAALGLTETTAGILYARGMDTPEKARAFLTPSRKNYLSPFLMSGMREAVELITRARDEEWRVAVFGDYDADGIGACAVLSRALREFGIEPYVYVPERLDGYGMSVDAIDKIFDEFLPDLFITVDCGVSNKDEVAYIQSQGAYVIVTDHHELPEALPDCILINPKVKDDYPYDNLCGAGVAFKLAQALIGERAYPLADFVALSTVADSVPLLGENRDIVAEGLAILRSEPHPVFSALLERSSEVTAQTLAFTVAPRVNAAGRMGDVNAALRLFTSEDEEEIAELAARLSAYNSERQKYCDELYAQASRLALREGPYGNVVMLAGEDWNAGFVGIVAARIADEFSRPAFLFVRHGDVLKGSARSIENVNIFEALKACSEHITTFGGHAQAAGVSVTEAEFPALKAALDDYIGTHYTREDFLPVVCVAGESTGDFRRVAHELSLLEPCGMGNRRPLFYIEADAVDAAPLKPGSPHIGMSVDGFDLVYFGGAGDLDILRSDLKKRIVFEYNLSTFRGKEYVKGFVRCVLYDGASGKEIELDAFERQLRLIGATHVRGVEYMEEKYLNEFCAERITSCAYGLCAVANSRAAAERFSALKDLPIDVFRPSSSSCLNTVLYAPASDVDLSAFREVVVLDGPVILPETGHAKVFANASSPDMDALKFVDCSREALLDVFAMLRRADGTETGESYAAAARVLARGTSREQLVFALAVFEELGLLSLAGGRLHLVRGKHTDLSESAVYRAVRMYKEGR